MRAAMSQQRSFQTSGSKGGLSGNDVANSLPNNGDLYSRHFHHNNNSNNNNNSKKIHNNNYSNISNSSNNADNNNSSESFHSHTTYNRSMSFSDYNRNRNKNNKSHTNNNNSNATNTSNSNTNKSANNNNNNNNVDGVRNFNTAGAHQNNKKTKKQGLPTSGRVRTLSLGNFLSSNNNNNNNKSDATFHNNNHHHNNNNHHHNNNKFDYFSTLTEASRGNIFNRRDNMMSFGCLEATHHNPYQIKIEDDGPHGTDDIRIFTLTQLTSSHCTHVTCCCCQNQLRIFDKFPLIDGTLFLSPVSHLPSNGRQGEGGKGGRGSSGGGDRRGMGGYPGFSNIGNLNFLSTQLPPNLISSSFPPSLPLPSSSSPSSPISPPPPSLDTQPVFEKNSKRFFLNALCVECLALHSHPSSATSNSSSSNQLRCIFCNRVWLGSYFIHGTLYCYDIFAAVPCCQARLLCKQCQLPILAVQPEEGGSGGGSGSERSGEGALCSIMAGSRYVFNNNKNNNSRNNNNANSRGSNNNFNYNGSSNGYSSNSNRSNSRNNNIRFFSDFSGRVVCPHCGCEDHHFTRPLHQLFVHK